MQGATEEAFALPTPDGKKIYGLLNRAEKPSGKVVILSHGLTGHPREYLHIIARDFFTARGYDVVRFAYYSEPSDARKLQECTVLTHADDLNIVCDHFRTLYKKIYVAGHSYGGLTMFYANPDADALGFWDASFHTYESFWKTTAIKLEGTPYFIKGWGDYSLMNPAMIEFDKKMSGDAIVAVAQKINTPSLVVLAGLLDQNPVRTIIYDSLTCEKKLVDIKEADHCFTNGQTVYDLLKETIDWFDQH